MVKGVCHFPFKPDKVRKYYEKLDNRPLYDEQFGEGWNMMETIVDKENEVEFSEVYFCKGKIKIIDPRDTCFHRIDFKVGDVLLFEHRT